MYKTMGYFADTPLNILNQVSSYTIRAIGWDWAMKSSKLDLSPAKYEFGDLEVRPLAVPGVTELV